MDNTDLTPNQLAKIRAKAKAKFWGFFTGSAISWTLLGGIALGMYGCPRYRVYQQEMEGKAEFKRAEQNRLIQIEEAKANFEAQKLNAESEIERAKGMAKSIEIENGKLTPLYLRYLWVRNIDKMNGDKIYIPTEANIPLLEAKSPLQSVTTDVK